MRLLLVTQDFPPDVGGIQTYAWELARRLADATERMEVIAPHRPSYERVDETAPFRVTRVRGRPDWLPITGCRAVVQRARALQPHISFHAQWQTVGTALLARAITGWPRRIVCAAHGRELLFNGLAGIPGGAAVYQRLRHVLLHRVDRFVPVSHYTGRLLRQQDVPLERIRVVPNGTDPDRFQPQNADALRARLGIADNAVLLTVGRLVPRKGLDTTLRALPAIAASIPTVTYLIAGTGPDRTRLERLAERLGIRNRVRFRGQVPYADLPTYYSAADLFVMPSREDRPDVEGFGLVFLEANACGTPVVGARSGGIPDAIVAGETGVLVPPGQPEALATSICHLLSDPDKLRRMEAAGRRYVVKEASWEHVTAQLQRVIEEEIRDDIVPQN